MGGAAGLILVGISCGRRLGGTSMGGVDDGEGYCGSARGSGP
jgi:hypothetical protein